MLVRKGKEMKIFNIVITTKANQRAREVEAFKRGMSEIDKALSMTNWSAINPVIYDLECLRANTWDQDKITYIQEWLKDNFEVK